jgi:protein-disulfide isomerase
MDTTELHGEMTQPLTRRERRQLRRAEMRSGQDSAGRRRWLRRVVLWGLGILVLGGVVWGMTRLAGRVSLPAGDGTLAVPVSDTDHILGPASASATLVEYSDLQCPACKAFQPVLKQLMTEPDLAGKIRLVYRHFPLTSIHKNAELSARAAEAAALQDAFWQMHDKLFEEQAAWSGLSDTAARDTFLGYAEGLGLDRERFESDMDSDAVKDRVQADADGGRQAGVNSTPSFFLNGAKMAQFGSYEEFKAAVSAAANAASNP